MAVRVGIFGYGNLGRGVELAVNASPDMELVGVFTRRDPSAVHTASGVQVYAESALLEMTGQIDVLVLCGGSATDLPVQGPKYAALYNIVDSFDTHANIPAHFADVDKAARDGGKLGIISCGWDPGMFSLARIYAESVLPGASTYTFWGKGVSQGHSDAIRRIDGVVDARQYTVPVPEAMEEVRAGRNPELTTRQKHTRVCYVAAEEGADLERINREIVTMPNYFSDYDTTVHFITLEQLHEEHSGLPHGGSVISCGTTGANGENTHVIEYKLDLDSNPEFTGSILAACARAVARMAAEGRTGCITLFDVAPAYLSPQSGEELRAHLL